MINSEKGFNVLNKAAAGLIGRPIKVKRQNGCAQQGQSVCVDGTAGNFCVHLKSGCTATTSGSACLLNARVAPVTTGFWQTCRISLKRFSDKRQ